MITPATVSAKPSPIFVSAMKSASSNASYAIMDYMYNQIDSALAEARDSQQTALGVMGGSIPSKSRTEAMAGIEAITTAIKLISSPGSPKEQVLDTLRLASMKFSLAAGN